MPVYQFEGRRYDTGAPVSGTRSAQNQATLVAALQHESVMPISISESGAKSSRFSVGKGASGKELALFAKQFSVMLDAGLPLVQGLSILADQQKNPGFKTTLEEVGEDVQAGATFSDALRKHPKFFDNLFVNMVAAGEASGALDVIFRRLSVFAEKSVKLKRAVMSASLYPAIIVLVAVIIVCVIMIWVIPVFANLFRGLNTTLPLPTRIVIQASNIMGQAFLPGLLGAILGAIGFVSYYRTPAGRRVIDRMLLAMPLIGPVLLKIGIARFSRTLSTLMVSGIPILEGLNITARTAGNAVLEDGILEARGDLEGGKTLAEPLKRIKIFPSVVTQIVGVGEQTGELDQMLEKLADYYEDEADTALSNLLTALEPIMIVFLGVVIGGIVISMYLPIFTLINRLAGG